MISEGSKGKGFWAWIKSVLLGRAVEDSTTAWIVLRGRFRPSMEYPYGRCIYRFWAMGRKLKPWWEV